MGGRGEGRAKSQETRSLARANEGKRGGGGGGARQHLAFEMEVRSGAKVGLDQKPGRPGFSGPRAWVAICGWPMLGNNNRKNWTQIQVVRSVLQQGVASVNPKCSHLGTMCPSERAR